MNSTIPTQTEKTLDQDSLLLASLIINDVNQLIRGTQTIVTVLLRYAMMGISITNCLMAWIAPTALEQN